MRQRSGFVAVLVLLALAVPAHAVCPAGPTLILPSGTAQVTEFGTVGLKWSSVPGAVNYDVYFGPSGSGCSAGPVATESGTTFQPNPGDVAPGQSYEWKIVANSVPGCVTPPTSSCGSFTTDPCPASAPTLESPLNGVELPPGPITLEWSAVPNARKYEVFIGLGGATPSSHGFTTATSKTLTFPPNIPVDWYVIAHAYECSGMTSSTHSFDTAPAACPDGVASQITPDNNATFEAGVPIKFQWSPVPGAVSYDLKANDGGGWQVLDTTTVTTTFEALTAGSWEWEVRANFADGCESTYSSARTLTIVEAEDCDNAAPVLVSPAAGATGIQSPVTFEWRPAPGAIRYHVFASIDGGEIREIGSTTGTSHQAAINGKSVFWAVAAAFGGECPPVRSEAARFSLAQTTCDEATINLRAPAQGAEVSSPVTLAWSPVAGATAYRVWVALDGAAPVNISRTAATEATINLPSGAITWRIEALRPDCDPVLSPEGRFTVRGGNCTDKQPPALVGPIGTAASPVEVTNPVILAWNAVAGTIGYRVWLSVDGNPFEDVGLTRETSITRTLREGGYEWFAEALYENCRPVPSQHGFFVIRATRPRCTDAVPTILSPASGASATSPVTIRWAPVENAVKYRVFASLDGSEPQLIGVTDETELERSLPPGAFVLAIEAVFAECPSTFSPRVAFTVRQAQNCSGAASVLLAPRNGSTFENQRIDLSWEAVDGAIGYVVMAQLGDGAPTPLAETTLTSIEHRVPPGRITWWVRTFFGGCDETESARATFVVTDPGPACDNRRPLLFLPSEDGGADVTSPVHFEWSAVPGANGYQLWAAQRGASPAVIAATDETSADVELPPGKYFWFAEALFDGCPSTESAASAFLVREQVACGTPDKPEIQVVGQALSNTPYKVRWTRLPNVILHELQESTSLDFSNAETLTISGASFQLQHEAATAPVQYLYRVRGISNCSDERGPYSDVVGVFVIPPKSRNGSAEVGVESNIVQQLTLPGTTPAVPFTATVDKPWLTVSPASGTLGPEGITLTVTADPGFLNLGTNTGTVTVVYGTAATGGVNTHATTTTTTPISISIVTPVTPGGQGSPSPDTLIIPAVARAAGANDSFFESDVRVTNLGSQTAKYSISFTPSGTDGTQKGSSSTVEIPPSGTLALDDVLATLFGATQSNTIGALQIRPLSTSTTAPSTPGKATQLSTIASSRTYNLTPNGTFGQYIPALPFSQFVGKSTTSIPTVLSLQQIAQSTAYRSNFGFLEAAGQAATLMMRVYDTKNTLLAEIPVSLQPGEHKQINAMLAANGINDLADGRVEVEVTSSTGKVTAYASTVDNVTNDPLMVWPVIKGANAANRYTLPGMATINNGVAFWRSDVRLFNAGTAATTATLSFHPQGNPAAAVTREVTLDAGEIEVIDDILGAMFAQPNGAGGALVVTTPAASPIVASARTYNQTSTGTYGQFIPGVTAAQSVGAGERALNILQLEQSSRIRTNVGFSETTGQPANIEVAVILPDTKATPILSFSLAANEFRQIPLSAFNLGEAVYNARVTVKVTSGAGRVTAYGSAIDMITQDPTYVPAQ